MGWLHWAHKGWVCLLWAGGKSVHSAHRKEKGREQSFKTPEQLAYFQNSLCATSLRGYWRRKTAEQTSRFIPGAISVPRLDASAT